MVLAHNGLPRGRTTVLNRRWVKCKDFVLRSILIRTTRKLSLLINIFYRVLLSSLERGVPILPIFFRNFSSYCFQNSARIFHRSTKNVHINVCTYRAKCMTKPRRTPEIHRWVQKNPEGSLWTFSQQLNQIRVGCKVGKSAESFQVIRKTCINCNASCWWKYLKHPFWFLSSNCKTSEKCSPLNSLMIRVGLISMEDTLPGWLVLLGNKLVPKELEEPDLLNAIPRSTGKSVFHEWTKCKKNDTFVFYKYVITQAHFERDRTAKFFIRRTQKSQEPILYLIKSLRKNNPLYLLVFFIMQNCGQLCAAYMAACRLCYWSKDIFSLRTSAQTSKHGMAKCPIAKWTSFLWIVCTASLSSLVRPKYSYGNRSIRRPGFRTTSFDGLPRQAVAKTIAAKNDFWTAETLFIRHNP